MSKAHVYAPIGEDDCVLVDLPPERAKEGTCGVLNFWLYGMRLASAGWEDEYRKRLESLGFKAGAVSPCCFSRESDGVSCAVHGDDFTFEGFERGMKSLPADLGKLWLAKVRAMMGPNLRE